MTMNLSVSNFRRAADVSIDLGGLTGLFGKNESGKTSAAMALACLLTGETAPITGKKKQDALQLVAEGSQQAVARLVLDDCAVGIRWPDGDRQTKGDAGRLPSISRVAAGLDRPMLMPAKERAQLFIEALQAMPTAEELWRAIGELNYARDAQSMVVSEQTADQLTKQLEHETWDALEKHHADQARTFKGRWAEVTRTKSWGEKLAQGWQPEGFESNDLARANLAKLELDAATAKQHLEVANRQFGAALQRREDLKTMALRLPSLESMEPLTVKQLEEARANESKATKAYADLEVKREHLSCPGCGVVLGLEKGKLVEVKGDSKKAVDHLTYAEKQRISNDAVRTRQTLEENLGALRASIRQAKEAAEAVKAMEVPDERPLMAAKADALASAEVLEAARTVKRAGELDRAIREHAALARLLSPEGLRKTKLAQVMGMLRERLEAVAMAWGRSPITLTDGLELESAGRPYGGTFGSERWRLDAALQIAWAQMDGSPLAILDGADMLDAQGRNGLIKALRQAGGLQALVCMTVNRREDVPDFSKIGGASYWIEAGRSEPLTSVARKAA